MDKNEKDSKQSPYKLGGLSSKEFARLSEFIYDNVGIKLPPSKKIMIEARLQKRIRVLELANHKEYLKYFFSPKGMQEEITNLIDVVTTNTTDFFREPQHFDYLTNILLPNWCAARNNRGRLRIWSAGCSTGMEPYTLGIVLSEFAKRYANFTFSILATDISTQALTTAMKAIYDEERVQPVPTNLKHKYFMRSKDKSKKLVRIVPELRKQVTFRRLNFMEPFSFDDKFDIVFCRNVVIYFDKQTQLELFTKFCNNLKPGGHLFVGHSESLAGMPLPLEQVVPTVYLRK